MYLLHSSIFNLTSLFPLPPSHYHIHSSIAKDSLQVSYNVKHAIKSVSSAAWFNYLDKGERGRRYRAPRWSRKASPMPLAYLHNLMLPCVPKIWLSKESPTSLISCFSHVKASGNHVLILSALLPVTEISSSVVSWNLLLSLSMATGEAAVVRLLGGVSKRRAVFLFFFRAVETQGSGECSTGEMPCSHGNKQRNAHRGQRQQVKSFMRANKTVGLLVTGYFSDHYLVHCIPTHKNWNLQNLL